MFQKQRRSMLGRRHLLAQQQAQSKPAQSQKVITSEEDSGSSRGSNISWRGRRSEKKKTPNHLDKCSREFKKRLFSKSPGVNYMGTSYVQGRQEINHYSSNENLLNETGITNIVPTPHSTNRDVPITPATAHQLRVKMAKSCYGPLPSTTKTANESDNSTSSSCLKQSSFNYDLDNLKLPDYPGPSRLERLLLEERQQPKPSSFDFDNLKPPDSPGPSRLERLLLEDRQQHKPSSFDFDNLKPPDSPGPSRLDKLIMEEKLEQPLDPDLKKIQSLCIEEPITRLPFSPPLSSTCIGSPELGQKNSTVKEEIKDFKVGSGRKLSTIKEDCDVSVIEFELNERTISELDDTIKESSKNNTIKPNNLSYLENILEDHNGKPTDGLKDRWETVMSCIDDMEQDEMNRCENLKKQMETCQKNISNFRSMRKELQSLKHATIVTCSAENKENNNFSFQVPTCKKKLLNEEGKWFNSVKAENPGLLKTPNPHRRIKKSTVWTPHSLSKVLHDQMNELYD